MISVVKTVTLKETSKNDDHEYLCINKYDQTVIIPNISKPNTNRISTKFNVILVRLYVYY